MRYASRDPRPLRQIAIIDDETLTFIAEQVEPTDISGKVDKVTGKSLVSDTEIAKIHSAGSDNQDLSGKVDKITGYSLVPDTEISRLAGLAISDTAYDASSWDNNTDAPTKNAIRDKIESLGTSSTPTSWGKYF